MLHKHRYTDFYCIRVVSKLITETKSSTQTFDSDTLTFHVNFAVFCFYPFLYNTAAQKISTAVQCSMCVRTAISTNPTKFPSVSHEFLLHFQALRVSMEEQRQRQEEEQRRAQAESAQGADTAGTTPAVATAAPTSDEAMLERALALSTETPVKRHRVRFVSVLSLFWC